MGKRSTSRRLAMQALYQIEMNKSALNDVIQNVINEDNFPDKTKSYAENLVVGAVSNKENIFKYISKYSKDWPIDRLSVVDRSILILAIYELLYEKEVPSAVAINEAIELSKKYGGSNSPKFINGILGAVADEIKA